MIFVKQGDRRPPASTTLTRIDNDSVETAVDLTQANTVTFQMRPRQQGTLTIDDTATVVDAAGGQVEYHWAVGDTDNAGDYYASWVVVWNDGTEETFPTLYFDVVRIDQNLTGTVS